MKKKQLAIMIILSGSCIVFSLIWTIISSPQLLEFQKLTDASISESLKIVRIFKEKGIKYEEINVSEEDIVSGMNDQYFAYDLIQDDKINYIIILSQEKQLSAILDRNGKLVFGIVDTSMFEFLA